MRGLKRFMRLTADKRSLLVQTALIVGAVRIGLWLLPFETLQRLAERAWKKIGNGAPRTAAHLGCHGGRPADTTFHLPDAGAGRAGSTRTFRACLQDTIGRVERRPTRLRSTCLAGIRGSSHTWRRCRSLQFILAVEAKR